MNVSQILPVDSQRATLVGRIFDPSLGGPCLVHLRGNRLVDVTEVGPTMAELLEREDPVAAVAAVAETRSYPTDEVLADSLERRTDRPHLLAPCDLQAIKACGVTFARSMLERVIEERAKGDPARALAIRSQVDQAVGGALASVQAGSPEAARVKQVLMETGYWSQYLEVGIGPDAEVFTKAQVLSAVGVGSEVGILRTSSWNNPEPEAVLAVNSRGVVMGASLGNDVNLRDIEGRSALLLGKAKDNNASCAIGPFIRLFDEGFGIEDVRRLEITLTVTGASDGYVLEGTSSMREISRDPLNLVEQAMGRHHQYPDGMMLFLGTLFAPTKDRDVAGQGFTHKVGDTVEIMAPALGRLVNRVAFSDEAPAWTFGLATLMRNLAARGLIGAA